MEQNCVRIEVSTHWGEMDALGHINHTRYLTWCETARLLLFKRVGLSCFPDAKTGPILATANAQYLLPVKHPDRISVKAWISKIGTTSFVVDYELARLDEPASIVASCQTVVVVYDYSLSQKRVIEQPLRERLEMLLP